MEKDTLLLMMLLIALCWVGIFRFSGMATLHVEEPFTYAGRSITLERIYSGTVIISVDGEKDSFKEGETKTINGLKVTVSEIIYFPEKEDRKVTITLQSTTICGDNVCDLGEDSDNCCMDCGCPADYNCENHECVYRPPDLCQTDLDCDDLNMSTKDYCSGTPKKCLHQVIQCHTDKTCDDNNKCTEDWCSFNECINKPIEGCKSTIFSRSTEPQEKQEGFLNRLIAWLFG